MATQDDEPAAALAPAPDAPAKPPAEDGSRKRKASSSAGQGLDDGAAKRTRQDSSPPSQQQQESASASHGGGGRPEARSSADRERRASAAMQEEKRRGRRLFGGLLSTLSQSSGNSQQRRRQEIERRQLEKIQQQTAEDDKLRAERRAALHKIRLEQQIAWEEQVMRSRHAKELKLAQFFRTESKPEMYYIPSRLSRKAEDVIAAQVRDCKARISRELEDFKWRKEEHHSKYGPRGQSYDAAPAEPAAPGVDAAREDDDAARQDDDAARDAAPVRALEPAASPRKPSGAASPGGLDASEGKAAAAARHDVQDDSGDILVEAEEDMVIY